MSVNGTTETDEGIKGKINAISEITIPTKLEDMPDKCDYIKAKVEDSQSKAVTT